MPIIICKEPSVKQSFKDECDINYIMDRYTKNGQLPDMIKENPTYGDFSSDKTYQEALNIVLKADEQFMALPIQIREKFHHEPSEFLTFVENPANQAELINMGLATAIPIDKPVAVIEPEIINKNNNKI
jgi:phage internal scaffolding protein